MSMKMNFEMVKTNRQAKQSALRKADRKAMKYGFRLCDFDLEYEEFEEEFFEDEEEDEEND